MNDDFFSDLVPIKPANKAVDNVETSCIFSDNVLSAMPDSRPPTEPIKIESNDTLLVPLTGPMGEPRQKKDARETEKALQAMFESTFKRFAGGLQKVLEDVQARLDSVESQTGQIADQLQEMSEARRVDEGTQAQRFDAIFTSLRDIQRGVQVVRDKQNLSIQELIEAQAELAKLAPLQKQERVEEVPVKSEAIKVPAEPAKAPEPIQTACVALPVPAAPPAAAVPAPAPPAPAAPPLPTAPQQQETSFGGQTSQQAPQMPPSLPAYSAGPQAPSMHNTVSVSSMPTFSPGLPPPPPPLAPQHYGGSQQQPAELPSQNPFSGAPPPSQHYSQAPPPPPQFPGTPEALQHMQYSQAPPLQPSSQYDGYSQSPRPGPPPGAPHFRPPTPPMNRMDSYGAPPPPQPPPPSFIRTSAGYPTFSRPPPDAPPPPPSNYGGYGGPPAPQHRPAPAPSQPSGGGSVPTTRSVPLEKVIDDVASMGFSRHEVHGVISDLMDNGQSVDLNIVLDRLMRARG